MATNTITMSNQVIPTVTVSASATSAQFPPQGISIDSIKIEGFLSAQVTVTGSGTVTVGAVCSADGMTYVKPSTSTAPSTALTIATGLTATGGPDSDGKYYIPITQLPASAYLKFYVKETGGANSATVSVTIAAQ